jgi:hypothetical protein
MTYKRIAYRNKGSYQPRRQDGRCACASEPRKEIVIEKSTSYFGDVPSLAAVYGISQSWRGVDDTCVGFERGTIFDELNKPFMGDKCKNGGYCK